MPLVDLAGHGNQAQPEALKVTAQRVLCDRDVRRCGADIGKMLSHRAPAPAGDTTAQQRDGNFGRASADCDRP